MSVSAHPTGVGFAKHVLGALKLHDLRRPFVDPIDACIPEEALAGLGAASDIVHHTFGGRSSARFRI